ncbi:Unknown protein sequence [Pseudomonas caricapapayae]|nr:Unknown protein sequence [Pseudomonas caricapapayae]
MMRVHFIATLEAIAAWQGSVSSFSTSVTRKWHSGQATLPVIRNTTVLIS